MSSAVLVLILTSLSLSAALTPRSSIVMIQTSYSAKCGSYILPALFLQRQAFEVCKVEEENAECILSKCPLLNIIKRPTYYQGSLFPNEKSPLIVKKLQSDVYLKGQKVTSSYVVVKWDPKSKICSRVGVLHKSMNMAPFSMCQSFHLGKSALRVEIEEKRKKSASRVELDERGKRKSRFGFLHNIPEDQPV
ncbi:hypothetical protein HI914_04469 [Erysiphe necator]|nr:hypothetical protein HI914_07551 [Erysiphe necator]KAI6247688.1 hypothetical protein HI914_04469 [Erysiphe necator]